MNNIFLAILSFTFVPLISFASGTPSLPGTLEYSSRFDYGAISILKGVRYSGTGTVSTELMHGFPSTHKVKIPLGMATTKTTTELCEWLLNEPADSFPNISYDSEDYRSHALEPYADLNEATGKVTFISSKLSYQITDIACLRKTASASVIDSGEVVSGNKVTISKPAFPTSVGNSKQVSFYASTPTENLQGLCKLFGYSDFSGDAKLTYSQTGYPNAFKIDFSFYPSENTPFFRYDFSNVRLSLEPAEVLVEQLTCIR